MSHFYGDIQGNRGAASCGGSKESGIASHIRGWNVGARVSIHYDEVIGKDVVKVYATGGSLGHRGSELIAKFTAEDLDKEITAVAFK